MTLDAELSQSQEERLQEVIAAYLRDIEAGRNPDQAEILARHPELAGELQSFFAGQEQIGRLAAPLRQVVEPSLGEGITGTLGDFRIVREVGRGGMGIVYEAEQISLRRRVALKVLPFAATMDARHLQRFHNEAQAAACLHHTNIVPVFSVGSERGVHFYAMQFIDGQPLSEIIRQMRRVEKKEPLASEDGTVAYRPTPREAASTPPVAEMTPLTGEGRRGRDYYRKVAELGIQTAEALDHAHQLGIVHRDIKPGNLMLDGTGRLWVTDFGLAQMRYGEASLTGTGQMVGTPRYMSPEQAMAKRVPIDHRTDVYSLGVTLYELLALQPAFTSEDRHELLRQIAFEEPTKLRRLERAIPAEVETIVLKAMEKRPQDRYATAQELADDLRHWLDDRPIRARRPTLRQRARKWTRRHQSAVWVASLLVLVLMIVGAANAVWWMQQQEEGAKKQMAAETEAQAAFDEAVRWQEEERWAEALSAIRRAQGVLHGFEADANLRQQIDERGKDLEMAQRLEEARLQNTVVKDGHFDYEACANSYAEAFAWYGLDVEHGDVGAAAEFIRSRSIQMQLVAALDNWANLRRTMRDQEWKHLLTVARAADVDEWRNRVRNAWESKDSKVMDKLLASADVEKLLPTTWSLLIRHSGVNFVGERQKILLRQAQQRHPADFWINNDLALLLLDTHPPQLEEAIRYFMIAVALRPRSPGAHLNLGKALADKGRLDEAIAEAREAIHLKKDYAEAHYNLGNALEDKGRLDEAIAEYREAIRLFKDISSAYKSHHKLGIVLFHKGELDEAIAEFREAIRFKKDDADIHNNLGAALNLKGQIDEAIAECREAIRLKKDFAEARNNLGSALYNKGRLDEAIIESREAIRVKRDYAEGHHGLGVALYTKGQLDQAITAFDEAIRLKRDFPEAHFGLGCAMDAKGQLDKAIAAFREATRLKKDFALAHNNLGNALKAKGRLDEAMDEYREAIRLQKDYAAPHSNLGVALELKGQIDEAISECREAIHLNKDFADAHLNLGNALSKRGRLDEAIAEYREVIRLNKHDARAHNNLGTALHSKGQLDEAIEKYREAIRLQKDFVIAHKNLKDGLAERKTLAKVAEVLSGKVKANNPAEQLALASVCQKPYQRLYAASARFYTDAFAAEPRLADDLEAQHRYNAACAAALASCGQGADADKLDAKERARLCQKALDWLRADLKAYRQVMEKSAGKAGPEIAQRMQHWLQDEDFAGVRGEIALAKLPYEERSAWRKLWADVAEMLTKAQGNAAPEKKPDTKYPPHHHSGA